MSQIKKIVFYEIRPGDRRKAVAQSNKDPSQGGGARDLRYPVAFRRVFRRLFRDAIGAQHELEGELVWLEDNNQQSQTVQIWPPTQSRGGELRLAQINDLELFATLLSPERDGEKLYFFIFQIRDKIIGHFEYETEIHNTFNIHIEDYLAECAADIRPSERVMGFIDYEEKESYCHTRNSVSAFEFDDIIRLMI